MKDPSNLRIFVGAGISYPPPSLLPLFAQIRKEISLSLGVGDRPIATQLENIAPETFFKYLSEADVPIDLLLKDMLSSEEPNAIHFALAQAIKLGAEVWTTNADELIELADKSVKLVSGKNVESIPSDVRLFKLHGTISDTKTLAFRTQDVLEPINTTLRERLIKSFKEKDVVVCGYLGVDPDIRPALTEALQKARSAEWHLRPDEKKSTSDKYKSVTMLSFIGDENPSASFLKTLSNYGIDSMLSCDLVIRATHLPNRHSEDVRNRIEGIIKSYSLYKYHLAAGNIYRHAAQSRSALKRYRKGIFFGPINQRWKCGKGFLASILDENILGISKPVAIFFGIASKVHPWPLKKATSQLEREGQHERALDVAERLLRLNPTSPQHMIFVCAPARKSGCLCRAVGLSLRAKEVYESAGFEEGELYARALYEASYALRLSGPCDLAAELIRKYNEQDFGIYAGPRWKAWALCLEGCTIAQAADMRDSNTANNAIKYLEQAAKIFKDLDDPFRRRVVLSNLSTAYRSKRTEEGIKKSREYLEESMHNARLAEKKRKTILEDEVLNFEWAEHDRISGQYQSAAKRYSGLLNSKFPIHRILGHIGLSTIKRKSDIAIKHAQIALTYSRAIDFRFGIAHSLISMTLSGYVSRNYMLKEVACLRAFNYKIYETTFFYNGLCDQLICFPD